MLGKITFRVVHDCDKPFLQNLYAESRAWELQYTHWSDNEREAFMRQQFDAQDKAYKSTYIGAIYRIIQLNDVDIGRLIINRSDDRMHIIDITIALAYRGRGIGSDILKSLLNEAQGGKVPVVLKVEEDNPAIRLYRRLGFQQIGLTASHISMKWIPFLGNREI